MRSRLALPRTLSLPDVRRGRGLSHEPNRPPDLEPVHGHVPAGVQGVLHRGADGSSGVEIPQPPPRGCAVVRHQLASDDSGVLRVRFRAHGPAPRHTRRHRPLQGGLRVLARGGEYGLSRGDSVPETRCAVRPPTPQLVKITKSH